MTPIIKKTRNKATIAAMIGTALEYYDMSLYGLMAPLLVSIFLPTFDPLNALIMTFVFTPISIIVRPLGALMIGRIGDKYGRKQGLIISIGGMAIVTGIIGFLPTYHQIGLAAPILFLILRSLQGFFLAGEYNGGAIFVLEHGDEKRKGFLSGLYCAYTIVGILFATIIVTIISYLPKEYWRIPYILGFITGVIGLYIRGYISETPKFLKYKNIDNITFKEMLRKYRLIFISIGVSGFLAALCTMPTILMNSFLPLVTSCKLSTIMSINSAATILFMIMMPIFGHISDKISFNKSMNIAAVIILLASYPLISLISYNTISAIIIMKMSFSVINAWFVAPFHAWIQSLFHTKERYTAISFSYSVGYQLGGLVVPLSLFMWKKTSSLASIYLIVMFWALVAMISLYYERVYTKKHE